MKYLVRKSIITVIGFIWMPGNILCSVTNNLTAHDVENMTNEDGKVTRDSVDQWVCTHTGDFQSIEDWNADLEVGEDTIVFDWEHEGSEERYLDTQGDPNE